MHAASLLEYTWGGRGKGADFARWLPMFRCVFLHACGNTESVSYLPISREAAAVEHGFFGDIF